MRKRQLFLILGAVFIFGVQRCPAEEAWSTGSTLYATIDADLKAHDVKQPLDQYQTNAVCLMLGYFRGYAECSALAAHYDATALPFFLPDTITNEQIERTVYKFLADNPDKMNQPGDALVIAALAKAYPNPSFTPVTKR